MPRQHSVSWLPIRPAWDEVKEFLADIIKDDSRAAEVIRQMRSLVKKEVLEFALFDLTSTIREVVVLARTDAILHNIHPHGVTMLNQNG